MEDKNLRISCSEGVLYYEWWNEELDCYERLTINSVLWKSEYRNIRNGINAGIWEKIISDLKCNHIIFCGNDVDYQRVEKSLASNELKDKILLEIQKEEVTNIVEEDKNDCYFERCTKCIETRKSLFFENKFMITDCVFDKCNSITESSNITFKNCNFESLTGLER